MKKLELNDDQVKRYSRHILLPEVGGKGQRKLLEGRVLVIGTGGLGAPVSFYLAAAGVGTIGLVDGDTVEVSNLQRQIIHFTHDIGKHKTDSAREKMEALNPDIKVAVHKTRVSSENILSIIADYDVVVDGSDNFPTRYLVNDACVLSGKPLSHGGIFRFDGQVTTIVPGKGPCYRCLFPEPPPPGLVPSCQEAGILGVVAGTIGVAQATEVLKLLIGIGDPLIGRLLVYNALEMKFRTVKVPKNPQCPVCGPHPTITELIDYEEFCSLRS
ncbi:MAG: molybdopterin-synthase adenylyltransferase MoeB [Nitrospirae bacterium]|nr:molybdopterin-synthase adenylyltransferase MoeB [Nitrospirota bacterium]